jgi:hypothetical protein
MNALRFVVEGYFAAALLLCSGVLYFAISAAARARTKWPITLQDYRPIYSRSGRRNRVRY